MDGKISFFAISASLVTSPAYPRSPLLQVIDMDGIFGPDFLPHSRRKLVEKPHTRLPALRPGALRVMLVGANNEAVLKISKELQPFRLDRAGGTVREWGIFISIQRVTVVFHKIIRH